MVTVFHLYREIKNLNPKRKERYKTLVGITELILASLALPLAIWFTRKFFIPELDTKTLEVVIFLAYILISWFVLSRITAMAKIPRTQRYRTLVIHFARIIFIIFIGLVAIKVIFRLTSLPVLLLIVYSSMLFFLLGFYRLLLFRALKIYRTFGGSSHNVLIIADSFSDGVIQKLIEQKEWGFTIEAILTQSKLIKSKYGSFINVISNENHISNVIDRQIIDEVIYCRREVDIELINKVVAICNEVGVIFRLQSSVSPLDPIEFQLKTLNRSKDFSIVDVPSNKLSMTLKLMWDIYFSIIAIILLFPLFVIIAVLIKTGSKGPIFFKQERIGLRGRKFKLYKFRTMVVDAEEKLTTLRKLNEADGPVFKIKYDPRITKFGRFLRNKGLDELPQLFNVIKGEMSLIGPRPPLEEEIKQYERWQLQRLSVRPGITCTWQIIPNRHELSFEEWMHLDMNYIENWNLLKDIGLFFKTVKTFFMSGGH